MKKLISTFMIVTLLICCFTATAFASDQTVLTTTVPDATYTLNIPADQEIEFGETSTNIGNISVTDASGFAMNKDLKVSLAYKSFSCENTETEIPYVLGGWYDGTTTDYDLKSGESIVFRGNDESTVSENFFLESGRECEPFFFLKVLSSDWGKALAGDYSSTITFTAEVVSSNQ